MSHFSKIKTKLKDKSKLIKALQLLQCIVEENKELINPINHQHEKVKVDISIGNDIGFRLNKEGEYELVADIQTWNFSIPPRRFIENITQQYARSIITEAVEEKGFTIAEESTTIDNEITITATRWQ
tara:strand:- start:290 stop:670 length:381 start_codon:yes stop_codon:yes gene_type:complete